MPFRTSIPDLPPLDPLAIAPRYMPNAPVTAPHPSFQTPQTALPTLYFARNSDTRFAPKFATSNDGFRVCQALLTLSSSDFYGDIIGRAGVGFSVLIAHVCCRWPESPEGRGGGGALFLYPFSRRNCVVFMACSLENV